MTILKTYYKIIIIGAILLIIGCISAVYYYQKPDNIVFNEGSDSSTTTIAASFYVDVKGSVKKPGVYTFINGDRVIDAINMAGGLTSKGSTANINLSKKLSSEMVVYIYSKTELEKGSNKLTCNTECVCETIEINNCINNEEKININTASLDKLSTLPSIGEAKAKSIIDYRETIGQFKTIEDVQNVSGIGESIYNNIKEYISV